ncbi:unnamed protein product [Ranitomeya imitator]|uniref:GIY-YIG domain-containing protein n=1 Tax=Ranitomeya imitator TaxID=111125 RepID=A0ABN9LZ16_9NEOB|nr:unnamed protein product [Ranitomeya imitator]
MAQKFKERNCPSKLLAKEKACTLTPPSPSPPTHPRERVPFVHTHHPLMPKVHSIIRKHRPLLAQAYPKIESFNTPILMCTKRATNLRDSLDCKSYPIRGYYTCDTNFAIYIVKYPCGLLYVGETTQHVKDRIASHKSTIRCGKTWLPLQDHFLKHHHSVAQLKFQVVEHIDRPKRGGDRVKILKQRESYWIHTLDPLEPKGLNREINWLLRYY